MSSCQVAQKCTCLKKISKILLKNYLMLTLKRKMNCSKFRTTLEVIMFFIASMSKLLQSDKYIMLCSTYRVNQNCENQKISINSLKYYYLLPLRYDVTGRNIFTRIEIILIFI